MHHISGLLNAGRRTKLIALTAFLVLAAGAVAIAAPSGLLTQNSAGPQGLVAVGPVNASNGFPDWYRDTNGVDLMPCDDPQDKYCGGAVPAPDPTQPPTFPDNFPDEFFYQQAGVDSLVSAGGEGVLAEFDLEGAFGAGPVKAGDQIVFARVRYRINAGLQPDTDYKITQPYGTDTVHTDADANGFFVTQDVGVATGDFSQVLKGRVGPFLQWAPNPNNPADVPPAGYVGDGVTPHAVTGSPLNTNFVRIQGPGIGGAAGATNPNPCPTTGPNAYSGPVNDCIQGDNFVLVGKKSTTGGVEVTRATYERNATGGAAKVQVLADSKSSQDLVVRDGDNHGGPGRKIPTTPLRADGGRYMARVDVPAGLPATVDVINRGDSPQTVKNVTLTDKVSASAIYHTTASGGGDVLHVQASSSDGQLAPTSLTVDGFNKALGSAGSVDIATLAPPDQVTVTSSKGGSVTVPVVIDGAGLAALALRADAGIDQTVEQGAKVTLDGGGSAGDIDSMSWSAPAGVTLTGATTATPTFTAPSSAGKLTFTLTVTGNGKTQTDSVDVTVKESNPTLAAIAPVGATVLQNLPLTLDASSSVGAAKFEWSQVSGTPVTLNGDTTSSKLTFLFPKTAQPIVMQVRVKRADAPATGCAAPTCDTAQITLVPQPDPLNTAASPIRAKYDAGKGRWVVDGTSTIQVSNNVRVYSGPTVGGSAPLIGAALVDATGAWKVDVRGSSVKPAACNCVSVESDRGGQALSIPIT
jgi:K319-like protein